MLNTLLYLSIILILFSQSSICSAETCPSLERMIESSVTDRYDAGAGAGAGDCTGAAIGLGRSKGKGRAQGLMKNDTLNDILKIVKILRTKNINDELIAISIDEINMKMTTDIRQGKCGFECNEGGCIDRCSGQYKELFKILLSLYEREEAKKTSKFFKGRAKKAIPHIKTSLVSIAQILFQNPTLNVCMHDFFDEKLVCKMHPSSKDLIKEGQAKDVTDEMWKQLCSDFLTERASNIEVNGLDIDGVEGKVSGSSLYHAWFKSGDPSDCESKKKKMEENLMPQMAKLMGEDDNDTCYAKYPFLKDWPGNNCAKNLSLLLLFLTTQNTPNSLINNPAAERGRVKDALYQASINPRKKEVTVKVLGHPIASYTSKPLTPAQMAENLSSFKINFNLSTDPKQCATVQECLQTDMSLNNFDSISTDPNMVFKDLFCPTKT